MSFDYKNQIHSQIEYENRVKSCTQMFVACMNVNDMDVLLVHHTDPFHTNYIKPFSKYGAHVMFVVLLLPAFLRHVPTYCDTFDSIFLLSPCETTKRSPLRPHWYCSSKLPYGHNTHRITQPLPKWTAPLPGKRT